MNLTEKWNKLCYYFESFKGKSEESIQMLWEKLFAEIFGYSFLDNEIDSHRALQLGSTARIIPDIIIKDEISDLFVVELKREELPVDGARKAQLLSYLKQTHNEIGILVCDKMCLIDFNYNLPDENQVSCTIDFIKDNPLGIKFMEIFEKPNFTKEAAKQFINDCSKSGRTVDEISKQVTPELIRTQLKEYFLTKYEEKEIDIVLKKYNFSANLISSPVKPVNTYINRDRNENYNHVPVQKTEIEKLVRDINSVGKETFIKYFEYYNDPNFETRDIKELFIKNENFSPNSMASKASTGKGIVKRGMAKQALQIISEANIPYALREKAKQLLQDLD